MYANLQRLNLPHPEAVFELDYFRGNPQPFYVLAKEIYPGNYSPTISHVFIALLAQKGLLKMLFTQNIDCLERQAGVPSDLIIEAHGSFATQRCIECKTPIPDDEMKEHVLKGEVPHCRDTECNGLVKPDIVFFGEQLPQAFHQALQVVPRAADLVLVMGTSLSVQPFALLPELVGENTPRVLFNRDQVGSLGTRSDDVLVLDDCDAGIRKLADLLGWREELEDEWRHVIGDEEAEKQLARKETLHEEVDELATRIETGFIIEDDGAAADGIDSEYDLREPGKSSSAGQDSDIGSQYTTDQKPDTEQVAKSEESQGTQQYVVEPKLGDSPYEQADSELVTATNAEDSADKLPAPNPVESHATHELPLRPKVEDHKPEVKEGAHALDKYHIASPRSESQGDESAAKTEESGTKAGLNTSEEPATNETTEETMPKSVL